MMTFLPVVVLATPALLRSAPSGRSALHPAHHAAPAHLVNLPRRHLCLLAGAATTLGAPACTTAEGGAVALHSRNRGTNKNAIIQKDWWYENGSVPPQRLDLLQLPTSQPEFNAFGKCVENSCTYVPLKRRYEGYAKFAGAVEDGAEAFAALKEAIARGEWENVATAVDRGTRTGTKRPTGPVFTALLKAVLLANSLLVSENNPSELRDALLARFYVNEVGFAADELQEAAATADALRATAAWELGSDAWASLFLVLNRAIPPKVGEPLRYAT